MFKLKLKITLISSLFLMFASCFFSTKVFAASERRSIYLTANTLDMGKFYLSADRFSLGITDSTMVSVWSPISVLLIPNILVFQRISTPKKIFSFGIGVGATADILSHSNISYINKSLIHSVLTYRINNHDLSFGGSGVFSDSILFDKINNSEIEEDDYKVYKFRNYIFWVDYNGYYKIFGYFFTLVHAFDEKMHSPPILNTPCLITGVTFRFKNWDIRLSGIFGKSDSKWYAYPNPSVFGYQSN
jgi:hypothetical protein